MNWLRRFREAFRRAWADTFPNPPEVRAENRVLREILGGMSQDETSYLDRYMEMADEWVEARMMAGAGPGMTATKLREEAGNALVRIRERAVGIRPKESQPVSAQGAFGDIELALQNVEWRREINLSWLEFSRWGIQQIILISRLYYIKNPLIQRGINVAAHYVFGRGVEISSPDEAANEVLKEFVSRNERVLGQAALGDLQRRLYYDGQIFFALFADKVDKGLTTVRTIDATEIQEILCNPDDADEPQMYRRQWVQRQYDSIAGVVQTTTAKEEWYPALGYDPDDKPPEMAGKRVNWESPAIHMKGGTGVSKWHFDTPRVYAALDWSKAAKKFLEACATVKQALAQIALHITSKGGQQALEGIKQQLQTTVGPNASLWDTNPTPVNASIFASGPGTTLEAFKTSGAGGDPEEVRRFIHMVAMALDLPEHFFADVTTGALATAQTLDRPTELAFQEKQERWREVLVRIAKYALDVDKGAPSGKLREREAVGKLTVTEARRVPSPNHGRAWMYEAKQTPKKNEVLVTVSFPAIREGDLPAMIKAWVEAGTLDNKVGQIVGIDEKVMVRGLLQLLGVENADDLVEEMYPDGEYDPDRTKVDLPDPLPTRGQPQPGGEPQAPPGTPVRTMKPGEAARRLVEALERHGRPNGAA